MRGVEGGQTNFAAFRGHLHGGAGERSVYESCQLSFIFSSREPPAQYNVNEVSEFIVCLGPKGLTSGSPRPSHSAPNITPLPPSPPHLFLRPIRDDYPHQIR